jgi:hypothetical protein
MVALAGRDQGLVTPICSRQFREASGCAPRIRLRALDMRANIRSVADVHWTAYPAAFGGFVAAAVAAWIALRSTWLGQKRRPDLHLLYDHYDGDDFAVGVNEGTAHWVRLRVENAEAGRAGRDSADDVEMLIVAALREDGGPLTQLNGCAFIWSNVRDPAGRKLTRLTIPPGTARRFDLLAYQPPEKEDDEDRRVAVYQDGADGAKAWLRVIPTPFDNSHGMSEPGHYLLHVVVTARDTDATYYRIGVEFDGKWWGVDSIRDHLKVTRAIE